MGDNRQFCSQLMKRTR